MLRKQTTLRQTHTRMPPAATEGKLTDFGLHAIVFVQQGRLLLKAVLDLGLAGRPVRCCARVSVRAVAVGSIPGASGRRISVCHPLSLLFQHVDQNVSHRLRKIIS